MMNFKNKKRLISKQSSTDAEKNKILEKYRDMITNSMSGQIDIQTIRNDMAANKQELIDAIESEGQEWYETMIETFDVLSNMDKKDPSYRMYVSSLPPMVQFFNDRINNRNHEFWEISNIDQKVDDFNKKLQKNKKSD